MSDLDGLYMKLYKTCSVCHGDGYMQKASTLEGKAPGYMPRCVRCMGAGKEAKYVGVDGVIWS